MNPGTAYRRLKTLLEEAGLPSIRFHDLRHTFATHALTSGVDAKTLAGILGHTNASFTLDTYTHVTPDMREAAGGIVGGFMEDLFGKELKPWQRNESRRRTDPSACRRTLGGAVRCRLRRSRLPENKGRLRQEQARVHRKAGGAQSAARRHSVGQAAAGDAFCRLARLLVRNALQAEYPHLDAVRL